VAADAQRAPEAPDGAVRKGTNWTALLLVLLGTVVVVGGGTALAIYCFSDTEPADQKGAADGGKKDKRSGSEVNKEAVKKTGDKAAPKSTGPVVHHGQEVQIDKAIELGLKYLKLHQNPDGTWTDPAVKDNPAGLTFLVALTLLEHDIKKDDPGIKKAIAYLRQLEQSNTKLNRTYDISLAILLLDRLDDPQDKDLIQKLALRLVAGLTPSGGWNYFCPVLADADGKNLLSLLEKVKDKLTIEQATSKLVLAGVDIPKLRLDNGAAVPAGLANLAVWRNDIVVPTVRDSDNSNTQFAVLGLWAAKSRGMPLQRPLALVAARFHKAQNADGSWGYLLFGPQKALNGLGNNPAPMVCAGLLGLAVGQGLVNEINATGSPQRKPAHQDPAIQKGLAYVAKNIADPHEPWENASAAPIADMYFMWSVERIGVIFSLPTIGNKDWYGWGAEKLVANQKIMGDQGYWENGGGYPGANPLSNTCFGLLFLKRANLAKDLTAKLALEN
jgi:hypothetical protein